MKKLSIFFACAAAMLGFSACNSETDPVLTMPTEFVLNEPVFAHEYYQLTDGNTFELVASQPDYGYAAAATYGAQVSLSEDFETFETLNIANKGTQARMIITDKELATALCNLHGFDAATYEDLPAAPIYLRATCEIPGVEGTAIISNVVKMDQVKFYHATQGARVIYMTGTPTGWCSPTSGNIGKLAELEETGVGTNIYVASITFGEGENYFRFYTELDGKDNGWAADGELPSFGAAPADGTNVNVEFDADGVYEGAGVPGKGCWIITMAEEGPVLLTVNLNDYSVKFEAGKMDYSKFPCMYIVGNISGWVAPSEDNAASYDNWKIYDLKGDGIYVNVAPIVLTQAPMFRFYTALTGWDGGDSIGYQEADSATDVEAVDGVFEGAYVSGKGAWNFPAITSGTMDIVVDTNTSTVKFTFAE